MAASGPKAGAQARLQLERLIPVVKPDSDEYAAQSTVHTGLLEMENYIQNKIYIMSFVGLQGYLKYVNQSELQAQKTSRCFGSRFELAPFL